MNGVAATPRTKVIATLGPAVASVDLLLGLFQAGCDVCRLNFSHGSLDDHAKMLAMVREAAAKHDRPVAILGDLCGPKIRLGRVPDIEAGGIPVHPGERLVIHRNDREGARTERDIKGITAKSVEVGCNYPGLVDDVQIGQKVLVEDGLLRFVATEKEHDALVCQCIVGGILKSRKGVNLPNTLVNIPSITDYDWQCVNWAVEHDLDFLALSFVRSADDIRLLQQSLQSRQSRIHVVAKIEKSEALDDIDAIISATDALMVARGDLGVELDLARVPLIQKDLILRCQRAAKPVIVATQMLNSMIEYSTPTRAEVSDVANAILDGTDAVMLSGETSVGKYPLGAVLTMAHVALEAEKYRQAHRKLYQLPTPDPRNMQLSTGIAGAVAQIVNDMPIDLAVVYSQSGATARVFSKHRLPVPILALTSDPRAVRQMALASGVEPTFMSPPQHIDELVARVDRLVRERKLVAPGRRIVVAAGASLGTPGTRNAIVVHTVGSETTSEIIL